MQLINLIWVYPRQHQNLLLQNGNALTVTGSQLTPMQVINGQVPERQDLHATHKEAYVIIAEQAARLAETGHNSIRMLADDTDVLLLLHFYRGSLHAIWWWWEQIHEENMLISKQLLGNMRTSSKHPTSTCIVWLWYCLSIMGHRERNCNQGSQIWKETPQHTWDHNRDDDSVILQSVAFIA